jgi:crossover junction endodeoxyribonuclease RuvC
VLILGVDPGLASTGYGLVRERDGALEAVAYGVVSTPPKLPTPARLQIIYRELSALIAEHRPTGGAMEKLFFSRNVSTAMSVGQARGVSLLALTDGGLDIAEYAPNEVKLAIAGYGSADKVQMQEMVRLLLGLDEPPRPDDAADALAVAICHLHAARFQHFVEE